MPASSRARYSCARCPFGLQPPLEGRRRSKRSASQKTEAGPDGGAKVTSNNAHRWHPAPAELDVLRVGPLLLQPKPVNIRYDGIWRVTAAKTALGTASERVRRPRHVSSSRQQHQRPLLRHDRRRVPSALPVDGRPSDETQELANPSQGHRWGKLAPRGGRKDQLRPRCIDSLAQCV